MTSTGWTGSATTWPEPDRWWSGVRCDLLGLPRPQDDTPPDLLGYARAVLRTTATAPGAMAMATFHDWMVSGGNRLVLLDDVLAAASDAGVDVSTTAASPHWLPAAA